MKKIALTLLGSLIAFALHAATWYVDPSASGSSNGTSWQNAWKGLTAISGVSAADTVYISGGSTSQTYAVNSWAPKGGADGAPITYQTGQDAGHNGMVILNAGGSSFCLADATDVVFSGNVNGAQHMELIGQSNRAVYVQQVGTHGMRFSYLYIPSAPGVFYFANPVAANGFEIDHCWVHKNSPPLPNAAPDDVVYMGTSTGFLIHDNYIELPCNSREPAYGDDCFKWGYGNSSIYNNHIKVYLDSNYPYGAQYQHSDIFQVSSDGWKIFGNYFENIGESIVFHDNGGTGSTFNHIWFYNNVIWQNPSQTMSGVARGLDIEPQDDGSSVFKDLLIANNTFCNLSKLFCIRLVNAQFHANVVNNIFFNCASTIAPPVPSGVTLISNTTGPVIFVNLLTGDLHLSSSDTIATHAGTNAFSSYFNTDKDGRARPVGNWSLGAYEPAGPRH
jgi:hypothetical protein